MRELKILIRGAGEMASGIAFRLYRSKIKRICMTEIPHPMAVRREVSFCEAIHNNEKTIQDVTARHIESFNMISGEWENDRIPVVIDEECSLTGFLDPDILIDAILAKRNTGTRITDAELVIGIGPGFYTGKDVHLVVETNRGHNLGKLISQGEAEKNTQIPGFVEGYGPERILRGPTNGIIKTEKEIGEFIEVGDSVAMVDDQPVRANISGVLRGIIRNNSHVHKGMKVGDVDPQRVKEYCYTISDKALAIGGGVLEALLSRYN